MIIMNNLESIVKEYFYKGDTLVPDMDSVLEEFATLTGVVFSYENIYHISKGILVEVKLMYNGEVLYMFIEYDGSEHKIDHISNNKGVVIGDSL